MTLSALSAIDPLVLIVKMAITAAIVVATSVIAERSRPMFAAMIATLPISAGPVLFFLALDHDDSFIRGALLGSGVMSIATAFYCLGYASVAHWARTPVALVVAFSCWAMAGLILRPLPWTPTLLLVVTIAVYAIVIPLSQRFLHAPRKMPPPRAWYAIPMRAGAVSLLVAAAAVLSETLGPYGSGLLAVMPIVMTSMIVILHPRIGGPATAVLLASGIKGMFGFGFAIWVAASLAEPSGRFSALAAGLAVSLAWNGALLLWSRRFAR